MDSQRAERWEGFSWGTPWDTRLGEELGPPAAAEAAEEWYRYIAETEAEGIWAIDEDGIVTFSNRKFAAMLGENPKDLQGKCLEGWLEDPGTPADFTQETGGYMQFRRRDGQPMQAVVVVTPLFDRQGRYRGTLGRVVDRTERQQQLAALQAREAQYRLLTEYATDIIALLTPRGELQYVSPAGTRLLGWELLRGNLWRWIHPQDRRAVALAWQVLQGPLTEPSRVCFRFQKQDGTYLWLETQFTAVPSQGKRAAHVVAVARDVTARKELEEMTLQVSERLQLALEGSGDGLWDWVLPDNLYLHPNSLALLGLPASPTPCAWLERVHPHYRVRLVQSLYGHLTGQRANWILEYPIRHADGTWRWLRQQGRAVARNRHGQVLRLAGTLSDITERKTAQQALQQQYKRELLLRQIVRDIREQAPSEQVFLRAAIAIGEAFQVSRCAIYIRNEQQLTATCVAEYLTDNALSVLGCRFPVVGNPAAAALLASDRVLAVANVHRSHQLGVWQAELLALRVQSCLTVRTSDRGRPTGLVVLHQGNYSRQWSEFDISLLQEVASHLGIAFAQADLLARERQQNRALALAKQQAEAANRAKSEFLAMMSHELRTPLNAILGFTDLVLMDTLAPQHREMLGFVQRSGEALLQILNKILDFTKTEAETPNLEPVKFSPSDLLNEILAHWQPQIAAQQIEVRTTIAPTVPPWAIGDRHRLAQILGHLLDNALKFGQGAPVDIEIQYIESQGGSDHYLEITVRDRGIGIAAADFSKLFEPFVQADLSSTRRYGGTGLGLAIADRLCRVMKGQLWVISGGHIGGRPPVDLSTAAVATVESGSLFGLRVPVGVAAPPGDLALHHREQPPHPSLQVLVVEDNPVNQRVLCRMLERLGHRTEIVTNGREALDFLRHTRCDVVLMDVHMPEMDGLEATRRIRQYEAQGRLHPNLPVPLPIVAVTANTLAGDRETCLAAGMNDYLGKPLTVGTLIACLEKFAGN